MIHAQPSKSGTGVELWEVGEGKEVGGQKTDQSGDWINGWTGVIWQSLAEWQTYGYVFVGHLGIPGQPKLKNEKQRLHVSGLSRVFGTHRPKTAIIYDMQPSTSCFHYRYLCF